MFIDIAKSLSPSEPSIPTSVGVAILFGYLQDFLKRIDKFPKINYFSNKVNFYVRALLSGIGTLGVSWVWSSAGDNHQLLVTIPAAAVIITGLWHWIINFGTQHTFEIILAQSQQAKTAIVEQKAEGLDIEPRPAPKQAQ